MEHPSLSTQPLLGKVALVTGASRGIGRAIAERLSRDGAAVIINYAHQVAQAEEVVAALTAGGGRAVAVPADVRQLADIEYLFAQTLAAFGQLDILVNNAGVAAGGLLRDVPPDQYAHVFDLNVRGVVLTTQQALRYFGPAGGRIINLSSVVGNRPSPGAALYAASKAAVDSLTQSWAAELGPQGILVNAVAPSLTATDLGRGMPAPMQQGFISRTALGRMGQPAEIADVVSFLAGPEARWITGQTIYADGGLR